MLVGLGVGADVLADAYSYVELEAPELWFLLSDVLFCLRSMLAILSVSAQHISCSLRGSLFVLLSRSGRPSILFGLVVGA